jgi:hypothetical protein
MSKLEMLRNGECALASATFRGKKRAYTGHATGETDIDLDSPIAKILKPELTEEMCIHFLKERNYKIFKPITKHEEI